MEKKIKYVGVIDKDGFVAANRVISGGGYCTNDTFKRL